MAPRPCSCPTCWQTESALDRIQDSFLKLRRRTASGRSLYLCAARSHRGEIYDRVFPGLMPNQVKGKSSVKVNGDRRIGKRYASSKSLNERQRLAWDVPSGRAFCRLAVVLLFGLRTKTPNVALSETNNWQETSTISMAGLVAALFLHYPPRSHGNRDVASIKPRIHASVYAPASAT